ncbi:MAG TPA: hypothetical protein PLD84_12905 [Chitinophagales bacterium]|nr:hypothetical protein [Chitinophagales bacterium]
MKILKKLPSSIALLLIGGSMVRTQIVFGDGCQGMPDGLFFLFLSLLYILILLIILSNSTIKYFRKEGSFNYFPLLTTLILIVLIIFFRYIQEDMFQPSTTLYATTDKRSSLTLRKNNTFKIQVRYVESSCFYKGKYQIENDTLLLARGDIQVKTDSMFAGIYLIDDNKNLLYPLDRRDYLEDTTRWLTIELPLTGVLN